MSDHCPGCGQRIWRLEGDRLLRCHRCGWTEGHPIIRYFTYLPLRLAQDLGMMKVLIALVAVVGALSLAGGFAGGATVQLPEQPSISDDSLEINATTVERLIHEEINKRRAENGLSKLELDSQLQAIARSHSTDMANRSYFAHEDPDGDDFSDRYDDAGYDCRVSVSSNRYSTGAENIAYTWYDRRVEAQGDIRYYETESELSRGIVNGWMNSTEHRMNILKPHWESEGIGIKIRDSGKVYATQNFC